MDWSLDIRERIALGVVATALFLTFVTTFLPFGFWSTAPRGYAVGAIALTPGFLLGIVAADLGLLNRRSAVDVLLSAVLAWYVGFGLLLHGEFEIVLIGEPVTGPFSTFAHRVGLAITGWMPLGVVGFVSGTVVGVVANQLVSLARVAGHRDA